jgi:hypothetical protein
MTKKAPIKLKELYLECVKDRLKFYKKNLKSINKTAEKYYEGVKEDKVKRVARAHEMLNELKGFLYDVNVGLLTEDKRKKAFNYLDAIVINFMFLGGIAERESEKRGEQE